MLALALSLLTPDAVACGGIYVPPTSQTAGAALYNASSHVVLAVGADGTTQVTIASDVIGEPDDFAFVLPVPELLDEDDLTVAADAIIPALATYDGPRSVEMSCSDFRPDTEQACPEDWGTSGGAGGSNGAGGDGVSVEGTYLVGDFEITILSAEESDALTDWLKAAGYTVPQSAAGVLQDYIDGGSYFLAAQVHADAVIAEGEILPALGYRLSSFPTTLPLRLGAAAAEQAQEVVLHIVAQRDADANWGISNLTEITLEDECMLPDGVSLSDHHVDAIEAAHAAAGEAVWFTEYAGNLDDPYWYDIAKVGIWPWDLGLDELGLDEAEGSELVFQRLHLRYEPNQLTVDPALYAGADAEVREIRYVDYVIELEEYLPVCGLGMIDGGTCPPTEVIGEPCEDDSAASDDGDETGGCGCASAASAPSVGLLALLIGLARRRT